MTSSPRHEGSPRFAWLLLGPTLALLVGFLFWPAIRALSVSSYSWTGFSPSSRFVGLEHYRALLADPRFWQALGNTLYYVAVGGAAHFLFAFLFSVSLTRPAVPGRKLLQTLLIFPAFISVAGVAMLWALLYEPEAGLLNRLFAGLGLPSVMWLAPGKRPERRGPVWAMGRCGGPDVNSDGRHQAHTDGLSRGRPPRWGQ